MDLAVPYLYQPWKHHLPFLKKLLALAKRGEEGLGIGEGMRKMGDSVTDLYIGGFSVHEVRKGIERNLRRLFFSDPIAYYEWLGPSAHRILILEDGSEWVLKFAAGKERWIHFHPARSSPLVERVRGRTLKTAFMVQLEAARYGMDPWDRGLVEQVRSKYWGLSPLQELDAGKGLGRALSLLGQNAPEG